MTLTYAGFYSPPPIYLGRFKFDLPEMMYYLYLPVTMNVHNDIRLPQNVECCRELIEMCIEASPQRFKYTYLSARKGWASPDNPLNRPGWHCDGFMSEDLNFIWCVGPGTRFAVHRFKDISANHVESLKQFEQQINELPPSSFFNMPERELYLIDSHMVHSTPLIKPPGCMRQFVKVSLSDHKYNLQDNSHNYMFNYDWTMHSRNVLRNDPAGAGLDYIKEEKT